MRAIFGGGRESFVVLLDGRALLMTFEYRSQSFPASRRSRLSPSWGIPLLIRVLSQEKTEYSFSCCRSLSIQCNVRSNIGPLLSSPWWNCQSSGEAARPSLNVVQGTGFREVAGILSGAIEGAFLFTGCVLRIPEVSRPFFELLSFCDTQCTVAA